MAAKEIESNDEKSAKKVDKDDASFEDSLKRLEGVVRSLEQGNLSLDDSISQYVDAMGHLKICYAKLNEAQRRVELLRGVDDQGNPITQVIEDGEMSIEVKREKRSQRRSSASDS